MPFSFRGCMASQAERRGHYRRVDDSFAANSNLLFSSKSHNADVEGNVECKLVSSNRFKKEHWTLRYCVLRDGVLYVYKDETSQESELISIDLHRICEFTSFYRFVRQSKTESADGSTTPVCVFTFSDEYEGILKLRVNGESDSHAWMSNFCAVFWKAPHSVPYSQKCRDSLVVPSATTPSSFGVYNLNNSPYRKPEKSWRQEVVKPNSADVTLMKQNSMLVEQPDLRRRLAAEYIDVIRRTDNMLEGREMVLRSQLDGRRSNAATISSMKTKAIADHVEEISTRSTSATVVQSHSIRPSMVKLRRSQSFADDETPTAVATIDNTTSNGLPTIVDDQSRCEDRRRCKYDRREGSTSKTNRVDSPDTQIQYTSSVFIQLSDRRFPRKIAVIDDRNEMVQISPIRIVVNSAPTTPQNTVSYAVSPSNVSAIASTRSTSTTPTSQCFDSLKSTSTPKSTPPPPKVPDWMKNSSFPGSSQKSTKPPLMPSSFLDELRQAAMKRQMSSSLKSQTISSTFSKNYS